METRSTPFLLAAEQVPSPPNLLVPRGQVDVSARFFATPTPQILPCSALFPPRPTRPHHTPPLRYPPALPGPIPTPPTPHCQFPNLRPLYGAPIPVVKIAEAIRDSVRGDPHLFYIHLHRAPHPLAMHGASIPAPSSSLPPPLHLLHSPFHSLAPSPFPFPFLCHLANRLPSSESNPPFIFPTPGRAAANTASS